ncbi:MAG: hypothetical protein AB7J28_06710 [Hyphomonadaceae bacterium]
MQIDLAALREWLGLATGIGALVALIAGVYRLRTLQRNAELQTNLAIIQAERSVWALALANPTIAPHILKERWGAENGGERLFACMLIDHYEALFFQYRRGAIPRSYWAGLERAMLEHIGSPSIRTVWDQHKDLYWPDFARHIERKLPAAAT